MLLTLLKSIWVICLKDMRVWWRHPVNMIVTFAPPLALLLVGALGSQAVGHSPVALVRLDNGPAAMQMERIIHDAEIFRLQDTTSQQAHTLLTNLDVVAIVTIPADFTRRVQAHESTPLDVTINNLNLDLTNDIRRSVPDMITQYYAAQGTASPLKVTLNEHNLRPHDIELFEYSVLPTIIFMLMISGLVTGGLTTAREWEKNTIKELLLSPVARGAIVTGKILASFLPTWLFGALVLLLCSLVGWVQPTGLYWLSALGVIALVSLFSSALGIAVGARIRHIQPVIPLSINVGMYLFFLAGGIGVLAFEPPILQAIAQYDPLTYGRHAFEMAVFYGSSELWERDVLILLASIAVALALSILSMRRGLAH